MIRAIVNVALLGAAIFELGLVGQVILVLLAHAGGAR